MICSAHLDLAEDVAAVTFHMHEALIFRDHAWTGISRYDVFGGFPGFCDHAGAAALALHRIFCDLDCDQWLDIVVDFSDAVVLRALDQGRPSNERELSFMAEAACKQAGRDGLVASREVRS